jgi:hypothetical protein
LLFASKNPFLIFHERHLILRGGLRVKIYAVAENGKHRKKKRHESKNVDEKEIECGGVGEMRKKFPLMFYLFNFNVHVRSSFAFSVYIES